MNKKGKETIYGKKMTTKTFQFTEAQLDKIARHGGAQWLRDMVDAQPEPLGRFPKIMAEYRASSAAAE